MTTIDPHRRVTLHDFNDIPDLTITETDLNGTPQPNLTITPLHQFATTHEPVPDALIGTADDTPLPSDGLLLMYGDGGAGKTTLTIDAACHLAAGQPWIGITVPKPIRILIIENEGPRGPFRNRLNHKLANWDGPPFHHNIHILEEPLARFTLTNPAYRHTLAHHIHQHQTELLIVGPLASLGARGTGTPDDINDFDQLISDFRDHAQHPFAIWIVHHENKQGDVSGAWERYPDTLVHIQAQGNGRTSIYWRKVRWSSALHDTRSNLTWADNHSYQLEDKPIRDIASEATDWIHTHPGWHTLTEIAGKPDGISVNKDTLRPILSRLVEQGILEYAEGPVTGRKANSKCWRSAGSNLLSQLEPAGQLRGAKPPAGLLAQPITEPVRSQQAGGTPRTSSPPAEPDQASKHHLAELDRLIDPADDGDTQ